MKTARKCIVEQKKMLIKLTQFYIRIGFFFQFVIFTYLQMFWNPKNVLTCFGTLQMSKNLSNVLEH
jgi:hypothetical protein